MPAPGELPLFPLPEVLLPGASFGLRVFEARYLDLVAACARHGNGFGVCLAEGDAPAAPPPGTFGTEALIEDFGTRGGLLALQVRGARRFRVRSTQAGRDGVAIAAVDWLAPGNDEPVRPEHGLLVTLLARILDRAGGEHARAPDALLDDADWVGWRLGELLPISAAQRLELLALADPHARLDRLLHLVSA